MLIVRNKIYITTVRLSRVVSVLLFYATTLPVYLTGPLVAKRRYMMDAKQLQTAQSNEFSVFFSCPHYS